jgi:hypothetical protein
MLYKCNVSAVCIHTLTLQSPVVPLCTARFYKKSVLPTKWIYVLLWLSEETAVLSLYCININYDGVY